MKKAIVVAAAIWLGSAVLAAGIGNAYFSTVHFTTCGNEELAWNVGVGLAGGPLALFVMFFSTGFAEQGWSLKPSNAVNCRRKP